MLPNLYQDPYDNTDGLTSYTLKKCYTFSSASSVRNLLPQSFQDPHGLTSYS